MTFVNTNIYPGVSMSLASVSADGSNRCGIPLPSIEQAASLDNLYSAYCKARYGKLKRADVAQFGMRWETKLSDLSQQLLEGSYKPGAYRVFTVYEKKTRTIMAATFIDRIVHHAVCNVVSPHLERSMSSNSCANRIGMGTKKGLMLFGKFAHNYPYVLKCDIRQFFPSIDRNILLKLLRPKIRDDRLLSLIRLILFVAPSTMDGISYFQGDTLLSPSEHECGLPIGNMTSQTWANWYLSGLDHFIMDFKGYGAYVRYVDDFAVFGADKSALNLLKSEISSFLESIRLRIHPKKSRIYKTTDGVPFLGFKNFRDHRILLKGNIRRFKRRIRNMTKVGKSSEVLRSSISGWAGFARLGDTLCLRNMLCSRFDNFSKGQGVTIPRSAWGFVEQQ